MELLLNMEHSRVEMVKWKRDFIKQIIILSAWIIAFAIPILDKWWIIKRQCIYNISLFWFIISIILWLIYFYRLNRKEENIYKDFMSFATWIDLSGDIESVLQNVTNWLGDIMKKLPNPIKFYEHEKCIQLSLLIIFVISLISMVVSVVL
jgi:hypothetical protein